MSPAAELRQASESLRAKANWWGDYSPWAAIDGDVVETEASRDPDGPCYIATPYSIEDAEYIATMHPGVGMALADWLDLTAHRIEQVEDSGNFTPELLLSMCEYNVLGFTPALQIARLINGGVA
jgi:hypothetical protein